MAQPYRQYNQQQYQYQQQQQDPLQALGNLGLAGVGGGSAAGTAAAGMSSLAASPLASLHSTPPPRAPPAALPPLSPGSLVSAFGNGSSTSNLISPNTSTTSSPPPWTAFPPAVEDDDDPFAALATRRTASAPAPIAAVAQAQAQTSPAQQPATPSASGIETDTPDLGKHLDDLFASRKAPPPPPPRRDPPSQTPYQQQQHQQQAQQQVQTRRLPSGGGSGGSTAPPCLELRPPPIRLDSSSITVLAEAAGSLWSAGQGGYLRVWQSPGSIWQGGGAGEEDTAACALLPVAAERTLCMTSYPASALMLTGHADGYVRAWSAQLPKSLDSATPASPSSIARNILRECELLAWQAHRTPVTALALTPYGDLWTGTDSGSIRVWSRNSLAQALKTGRPLTACGAELVHRTAGQGKLPTEVRQLVYVPGTTRLWSLTAQSVCIWNTRTCELVQCIGQEQSLGYTSGMFGADEFGDAPVLQKSTFWGRARSSLAATAQAAAGQWSTLSTGVAVSGATAQQWGTGLFGAGDKGGICAIAAAPDGTVWGGCVDGRVIHWEGEGLLIAAAKPVWKGAVKSICAVGLRVWAGSATGSIRVLDGSNGGDLGAWKAHDVAVAAMISCGDHVFSLASNGHIRGWDARSPCDADAQIRFAVEQNAAAYTVPQTVRLLAGTWNVNEQKPAVDSLRRWLGGASAGGAQGADVVCVGLQETEMSAGSIFLATAKETVGVGLDGSGGIAGMWLQAITLALGGEAVFVKVAARQLAGILIGVWVRRDILRYVSEADTATAAVACGLMGRTLGNKGGVAVRLVLHRRNVCLINSHFAAHTEAVSRRNADYEHIVTKLAFPARSVFAAGSGGMHRSGSGADLDRVGSGNSVSNGSIGSGLTRSSSFNSIGPSSPHASNSSPPPLSPSSSQQEQKGAGPSAVPLSGLNECDTVVWIGDMNYRVQLSYAEALAAIAREDLALLLQRDQLLEEISAKRVFQGFVEPPITFPPTYKFDKNNPDRLAYDSSEKQRVPAWCDRVLIREDASTAARVDVERYDSCMSVLDSDHKPVAALLRLALQAVDQASLRRQYHLARATAYQALSRDPQHMLAQATALSDNAVSLSAAASSKKLRLSNKSNKPVVFSICVDPQSVVVAGQPVKVIGPLSSALPRWMTVFPSTGVVLPRAAGTMTITMSLDDMRSMKEVGDDSGAWHDELPRNGLSLALLVTVQSDWFDQSTTHRVSLSCGI